MSQFLDKRRQLVRWQRSIDIAVTFCQLRREIIATQEHLQGASPADEPWQSLVAPPPGTSPTATSGWPKIALPTAAKHMSTASAISLPPPRARPSILAMVTLGMFLNRSPIVCVRRKLRVWDTILEAVPTRPKPEWAIHRPRALGEGAVRLLRKR